MEERKVLLFSRVLLCDAVACSPSVDYSPGILTHQKSETESASHSALHVQLFATPWTAAHQAPRSMQFSKQEYWSGLLFPSPGHLPDPGIEPGSPALQADSLLSEPSEKTLPTYSRL